MAARTVESVPRDIPEDVRPVAVALREVVRASAPGLEAIVNDGMPCYVEPGKRRTVVYISAAKDRVNLGFCDGVDLHDPKGLLEGTGKRLRHVKVRSTAAARDPALAALVRDAVRVRTRGPQRSRGP